MEKERALALVDWMTGGHHPMYFALFVRALLELGCTVAAFCPQPEEVRIAIQDLDEATRSRLTLHVLTAPSVPESVPIRIRGRLNGLLTVGTVVRKLRSWEAANRRRIDLVFFACIYDAHFTRWPESALLFPYPWSGLYLPTGKFRKLAPGGSWRDLPAYAAKLLRSPRNLKSLCIWDEGIVERMRELCGYPVFRMPDLSDETFEEASPVAMELKRFAAGAPIVGVLGLLKQGKGVTTLAKVALDPANRDLCFAFVGDVSWQGYNAEEKALMRRVMDLPNVFTHLARIPDEKSFNSCVRACDIVFAAYLDFADSSGLLIKAAIAERPLIVSDGYLMAARVRQFQLGEVVPQADIQATSGAIRKLLAAGAAGNGTRPNWQGYRDAHSYEHLKATLGKVVESI